MADIRSFEQEKEKREQVQEDYRKKIRKHKLGGFLRILLVLLVIGILIIFVSRQYRNHIYTSYEVVSSTEREKIAGTTDIRLGDAILTYSRDGAHCTDSKGNVIWNQTYEIQDILIDTCKDVAVIAEYNGRNVYVVSAQKQLGNFTTNLPIRSVTVSATGRVAVVMTDSGGAYYNVYSAEGEEQYNGYATMTNSGYPMAVSFSPNGELLEVSYIYLDSGVQKTNIAFYNLGAVGENVSDYLVSAYIYDDVLVPFVKFMDNDTGFAVGDSRLMLYKGSQKPTVLAEFNYTEAVRSVFYNENYLGLVFYSDTGSSLYKMNVYSKNGEQVGTYYFNLDYTDIFFWEDDFVVYNTSQCEIYTLKHVEKYNGTFSKSVGRMIPLKTPYKYLLLTNDSCDTIQLK
jgi:hypothetical protein